MKCVRRENAAFYKLRLDESCVFFVGPPAFGVVSCLQDLGYCYYQRLVTTWGKCQSRIKAEWKHFCFLDVCENRIVEEERRDRNGRRTGGTRERVADPPTPPPKKGSLDLLTFLLCELLGYILLCNVVDVAAVSKLTLGLFRCVWCSSLPVLVSYIPIILGLIELK